MYSVEFGSWLNDLEIAITRSSAVRLSRVLPTSTISLSGDVVSIAERKTVIEVVGRLDELTLVGIRVTGCIIATSHRILLTVIVYHSLGVDCWTRESRCRPCNY